MVLIQYLSRPVIKMVEDSEICIPIDIKVNANAVSALLDKIGPAILVTHSHSGGMGWLTAVKNQNIKAIVSYEHGREPQRTEKR
jgi:hypothetical protein